MTNLWTIWTGVFCMPDRKGKGIVRATRMIPLVDDHEPPLYMNHNGVSYTRTWFSTVSHKVFYDNGAAVAGMSPDEIEAYHVARVLLQE